MEEETEEFADALFIDTEETDDNAELKSNVCEENVSNPDVVADRNLPVTNPTSCTLEETIASLMTVLAYLNANPDGADTYISMLWQIFEFLQASQEYESSGNDVEHAVYSFQKEINHAKDIRDQEQGEICEFSKDEGMFDGDQSIKVEQDFNSIDIINAVESAVNKVKRGRKKKTKQNRDIKVEKKTGQSHVCPICSKMFKAAENLRRHDRAVHQGLQPYSCSVCERKFTTQSNWRKHMRIHSGVKPYLCTECGKKFTSHSNLKSHMLIHTGEKRHECPECGKCFSQFMHVQEHLAGVHRNERPYKCSVCDKGFLRARYLELHMRIHSGEKPHQCPQCDKTYSQQAYLNRHLLTHAELPHPCSTCSRRFLTRTMLKVHERTHTGERPYKCTVCGKAFSQHGTLHNHYKMHNKSDVSENTSPNYHDIIVTTCT